MEVYDFTNSEERLHDLAQQTLAAVRAAGADEAAISLSEEVGLEVTVQAGRPETIELDQQIGASIVAYCGKRRGAASCNSLAIEDLRTAAERALFIARQMEADECNGLPDKEHLASPAAADLDLHHPWRPDFAAVVAMAKQTAQASWEVDDRISKDKSDGCSVSTAEKRAVLANTHGFAAATTNSMHGIFCGALADFGDAMENGYWHDSKVDRADLDDHLELGGRAGRRAVAKAGASSVPTGNVPVLLETGCAHSVWGTLFSAISGRSVYDKLSFFTDSVGKRIGAGHLTLHEDPFVPKGLGSSHHDSQGIATARRDLVSDGVLQTYLLSNYYARKLGLAPTGHSGGTHNVEARYRTHTLAELFRQMGRGLFVTSLIGGKTNPVTGDYSAGASGFWIEDGEIAHPVRESTIAGNYKDLLDSIVAGGDDRRTLGGISSGSLLIEQLAVAGSS